MLCPDPETLIGRGWVDKHHIHGILSPRCLRQTLYNDLIRVWKVGHAQLRDAACTQILPIFPILSTQENSKPRLLSKTVERKLNLNQIPLGEDLPLAQLFKHAHENPKNDELDPQYNKHRAA